MPTTMRDGRQLLLWRRCADIYIYFWMALFFMHCYIFARRTDIFCQTRRVKEAALVEEVRRYIYFWMALYFCTAIFLQDALIYVVRHAGLKRPPLWRTRPPLQLRCLARRRIALTVSPAAASSMPPTLQLRCLARPASPSLFRPPPPRRRPLFRCYLIILFNKFLI
jgi:hypothetical protein